jgi:hypothetical protein
MNDWILTFTGKKFFPLSPRIEDICIEDIAHALSNICRFTGHCKEFYSVAQHSLLVTGEIGRSNLGNSQQQLAGLLHDASEAYLCDIARPVKYTPSFFDYRVAERRLQAMIYNRFKVVPDEALIKRVDDYLLSVEAFFLMPGCAEWQSTVQEPEDWASLSCYSPQKAKERFLKNFEDLKQ